MQQRIGEFLVSIGAMTPAQAEEVQKIQSQETEHHEFGEIAIEHGFVDDAAIRRYVKYH